jgi:hypothetical protein
MIILGGLAIAFILQACGSAQPAIIYDGKERSVEQVEEMLSDRLESENPDFDYNVSITEEQDN